MQDMSWTISCNQETVVTAFSLPSSHPARACWGYALQEADRQAPHNNYKRNVTVDIVPVITKMSDNDRRNSSNCNSKLSTTAVPTVTMA